MKFMYFSIKYRYIYNRFFSCNHTCFGVSMVSVRSASSYVTVSHYQSRSSMYIRGQIPRNSTELAEAVLIGHEMAVYMLSICDIVHPVSDFLNSISETY